MFFSKILLFIMADKNRLDKQQLKINWWINEVNW